jgi:cell wall assembly regulator SMI1
MRATWERIEAWLRTNAPQVYETLRPGATDERIAEAERRLGVVFPEPVRESYRIHDRQSPEGPMLIDAWEFLSLERIVDEWNVWKQLLDGGEFARSRSKPEAGIRPDWWDARWIPLTYSGSGDHHCLDLDPAPGGAVGQVILMWHDSPERPLVAPSFEAWLGRFADDLEAGEYVLSEEYGGLVRKDDVEGVA